MNSIHKRLMVQQMDKKLNVFKTLDNVVMPPKGWINSIRNALNMSLRQFGKKLNITPQSAKNIELREKEGSITIKALKQAAQSLDLKLVYGFIPIHGSLEKYIEKKAEDVAKSIVIRTSQNMKLEDQENIKERIEKAIIDRTTEIKFQIPKYLWD